MRGKSAALASVSLSVLVLYVVKTMKKTMSILDEANRTLAAIKTPALHATREATGLIHTVNSTFKDVKGRIDTIDPLLETTHEVGDVLHTIAHSVKEALSRGEAENGMQEDGTHENGTQVNGTHENGTQVNGTQENGTQVNGTRVNGAQENRTWDDGTRHGARREGDTRDGGTQNKDPKGVHSQISDTSEAERHPKSASALSPSSPSVDAHGISIRFGGAN